MPENIVESIKNILFKSKFKQERLARHNFVQNNLCLYFYKKKFITIREYELSYRDKYRNKKRFGEPRFIKQGKLDLYCNKNLTIAIVKKKGFFYLFIIMREKN